MSDKACNKCKAVKPIIDFSRDKHKRDGYATVCKSCKHAYKLFNQAAIKEQRKQYKAKHAAEIKAYMQQYRKHYREKNRAALSAASIAWNKANADRFAEIRRESRKRNAESARTTVRNRRARLKERPGSHTATDVLAIGALQRWRCACCHVDIKRKYHVDHIEPIAKGGSNDRLNLQLLCPMCNISKQDRHPVEFMQTRGFLC